MLESPHIGRRAFLSLGIAIGLYPYGLARAAPPWTWTFARSLNAARANHKAVLLFSGQVLVAGGENLLNFPRIEIASAELYDAKKNRWTTTGQLNFPRNGHTASLLPSGKVLVTGGSYIGNPAGLSTWFSSAEVYNPATGHWSLVASMNVSRSGHTATVLPSGQVLVVGGVNGTTGLLASCEVYDPVANTWTITGSLLTPRVGHTATPLASGKVLAVGGGDSSGSLSSAEVYDPSTGVWTSAGDMHYARSGHTATVLTNSQVLIAGGSTDLGGTNDVGPTEIYDPTVGSWTTAGTLNVPRAAHTATLLSNGEVLVAGGYSGNSIASAELYDPVSSVWSVTASLNVARRSHTATLLPTGKVLAAGGSSGSTALASAELFNAKLKHQ